MRYLQTLWKFSRFIVAYDESFRYLARANNKSKWSLDLYFKYAVKWFGISMILASLGSVALCRYMYGEIIKKYLYHPHRFVWVFIWCSYQVLLRLLVLKTMTPNRCLQSISSLKLKYVLFDIVCHGISHLLVDILPKYPSVS